METLKELENLYIADKRKRMPNLPYLTGREYTDTTANGLTKCIIDWFRLKGGAAFRINSQGQYDSRLNKWRPSGSRKGLPDIQGVMNGKFYGIEVKIGRDKQSEQQRTVESEITASGGKYLLVHSFDDFIEQINTGNHGTN
jgi:hypothetical protein